jgi:hypothetical protein
MPEVKIQTAAEMFGLGREVIRQARNRILQEVAAEAKKRIIEESKGELKPVEIFAPGKVTIGVKITAADPEGEKAREIERVTESFRKTWLWIRDKSNVNSLMNRKTK